jgi:predicted MFS family arabinose efflux permease
VSARTGAATVARAVAVLIACALPGFLVGSVVLQIREDFELGSTALGVAFSVYWGAAAVASPVVSRLSERVGPRWALRVAGAIAAASCLAVAALADSALALVLLLALGGTSIACATPAANVLLLEGVPARRRALAFGLAQSALPAGLLLAGLAVPAVAEPLGWRVVFIGASVLALLAAAAAPGEAVRGGPPPAEVEAGLRPSLVPLVLVSAGISLGCGAVGALNAFLVAAGPDAGMSGATAAVLLAVGSGLSIGTRLAVAARADSGRGDALLTVAALLGGGGVGYALVATGALAPFVVGALLVLTLGWGWMGLFAFSIVSRYRAAPERATGIMQAGFFSGGVVGPTVFGWLVDAVGFGPAWLAAALGSLVAALVVWIGRGALAPEPAASP